MWWWLGILILLGVGLIWQLDLLIYAMYVLMAGLFTSRWWTRGWSEALVGERECHTHSVECDLPVAVVLTVKNRSRMSVPWVLLEDHLDERVLHSHPPRIRLSGSRRLLARLRPGQESALLYQVSFQQRGYYSIGPLTLETGDFFGLYRRSKVVTQPQYITVFPREVALPDTTAGGRRPLGPKRSALRYMEDPTRMAGVRAYRPGDPLHRVHWRATARTGVLQSRIFEPTSLSSVQYLLDFHEEAYPEAHREVLREFAVTVVASMARSAREAGLSVGLASNGVDGAWLRGEDPAEGIYASRSEAALQLDQSEKEGVWLPVFLEPGRSPAEFERFRAALARLEPGEDLSLPDCLVELEGRLPRDGTLLVVTGNMTESLVVSLGRLRARGFVVEACVVEFTESDRPSWARSPDWMKDLLAAGVPARIVHDEASLLPLVSEPMQSAMGGGV